MAELITTRHARFAMERRGISRKEIRASVFSPELTQPGKRPRVERRIAGLSDRRIVAVVVIERRFLRLLTAYIEGQNDPAEDLDEA